jgi:type III secretion protein R
MSTFENAALLALVALLPLIVLTLTSFVKVSVVLSLLRNAIGATDAPSGLVITGLSLVLTFFVMAPVAVDMVAAASAPQAPAPGQPGGQPTPGAPQGAPAPTTGIAPTGIAPTGTAPTGTATAGTATAGTRDVGAAVRALVPAEYASQVAAAERALEPLRGFLWKHTRAADRETFSGLAGSLGSRVRGNEIWVLAPAFIASELREAFMIAILIFIPFLVIDLIVALSLASLGLTTTSPQTVALPLKLVLFVAVDGWRLLLDGLLRGYV